MEGLVIGRIVHFVQQLDGQVGTSEYAALVSRIHEEHHPEDFPPEEQGDRHEDGDVTLFVFMDTKPVVLNDVPYSAEKLPNTWHWPERA